MKKLLAAVMMSSVACAVIGAPPSSVLQAQLRQDPTGEGSFHRLGMFRQLGQSTDYLEKITEALEFQPHANTMYFATDNIFNTPADTESGTQLAEFLGASLKANFTDQLNLNTSYDYSFFRYQRDEQASNDFDTSTVRQQLNYEIMPLETLSVGTPLSWQYSRVAPPGGGDAFAKTWTFGASLELNWYPASWAFPSFSYNYFTTDPEAGSGKNKHDLNLGVTFRPIRDTKLYVIPSVQYTIEDFKSSSRQDDSWTPTMTVSWTPLDFLAIDAVVSYTDSRSTDDESEFNAWSETLFVRLFKRW